MSEPPNITCGIPQGSNLGPLLLLIYNNDLLNCLETIHAALSADDTNISCQGDSYTDIEQLLNIDLENVHKWLTVNKLTLNMEKTECIIIGSKQKLNHISANPYAVIEDQRELECKEHVDAQSKRISNNIALPMRAKEFVTQETLIKMYNALVILQFIVLAYGLTALPPI